MEEVTPCMPGASLTEPPTGDTAKFKLTVKLGPIAAAFLGDTQVERYQEDFRGVIRGNARDSRGDSRVKGTVNYALQDESNGSATGVDINVDFTLTGRLAQFSRAGIVNDLAARLTADFARNLESALARQAHSAVPAPGTAADEATAPTAAAPPRANELKAGSLLIGILWARIKKLFGAIFLRH